MEDYLGNIDASHEQMKEAKKKLVEFLEAKAKATAQKELLATDLKTFKNKFGQYKDRVRKEISEYIQSVTATGKEGQLTIPQKLPQAPAAVPARTYPSSYGQQ